MRFGVYRARSRIRGSAAANPPCRGGETLEPASRSPLNLSPMGPPCAIAATPAQALCERCALMELPDVIR